MTSTAMNPAEAEAVCAAASILPPEARRRLVEIALSNGYAAKDLAEIMAVSPPAVSRYVHGSLAPSPGALCRLILGVEESLRARLVEETARQLWRILRSLLSTINYTDHLLEEIADDIAKLIEEKINPASPPRRQQT